MNEIATINQTSITRQIEQSLVIPQVLDNLSPVDKRIVSASKGTALCEGDKRQLLESMLHVFTAVAKDLNVEAPNQYTLARITEILLQYHKPLTMQDVKLAFELALVGELQVDNKAYGKLSIEYIGRILNAYKERRGLAFARAEKYAPKKSKSKKINEAEITKWHSDIANKVYVEYRDTGKLTDNTFHLMVVYEKLKAQGRVKGEVTDADRKRAFALYKAQVMQGLINKHQGAYVRREGIASKELDYPAQVQAQRREIKEAFDEIIKEKQGVPLADN